ncbi:50S ribosomal protein L25 [bacterium]|nr:MAG: 50S ribosomal protein L25 [bacterium]
MKSNTSLNLTNRDIYTRSNRALRKEGNLPGSVYSAKEKSISVEMNLKEFASAFKEHGYSGVIKFQVGDIFFDGIIREVQIHPVSMGLTSFEIMKLDQDRKIKVNVPFEITGVSLAVKNNLGFLVTPIDSIPLEGLPKNLPETLTIDISELDNVGESILMKDINLPEGVEFQPGTDIYIAIATIVPPQKETATKTTISENVVEQSDGSVAGSNDGLSE